MEKNLPESMFFDDLSHLFSDELLVDLLLDFLMFLSKIFRVAENFELLGQICKMEMSATSDSLVDMR